MSSYRPRSRSRSPSSDPSHRRRRSPEPYNPRARPPPGSSSHHRQARSPLRWADRGDRGDRRDPWGSNRRSYHDRDRPVSSGGGGGGSRGDSSSPDRDRDREPERPSKEIMMDNLAPHLTEHHILQELREHYHVDVDKVDDVRIIRDRQTKRSRGFGFLRFASLDDAQAFMAHHQPVLYLYGDSEGRHVEPESARVRISYGRERKEPRPEDADWTCSSCHVNNFGSRARCFRCQTARTESAPVPKAVSVGDNDASTDNTPSQFLLFRGLEASVTEEHFAKGVAKLNKPGAGAAQPPSSASGRTTKVASTTGDANLGAKEGTLRRVLLVRDRRSNESWRYGFAEYASIEDAQAALTRYNSFDRFTIASKQVLVSYIHAGVFVPVLSPTPSTERFLFSPIGNPSLKLQYRDLDAYLTQLFIAPDPSHKTGGSVVEGGEEKDKSRKSAAETGEDRDRAKKRKIRSDAANSSAPKTASHLQFWSNRHAELHGIDRGNGKQKESSESDGAGAGAGDDNAPPTQSFADPERFCCYLCMRQFTSTAQVNKHERLSDLHRRNFNDPAKVARAKHKLDKHGLRSGSGSGGSAAEYRDRAKERRKIYGVVNKKGEQVKQSLSLGKENADEDEDEEGQEMVPQSKGASLLSKMGYTAGQGLGANAEGIQEPIKQDVYVAGVGLGAQGGKVGDAVDEAERRTKDDYRAWAERGRDNMRERYRQMG